MRSSAVVDIILLWSSPSPPHSLIYQLWCSCAHLLPWASSSRGLLPPTHSLIYQPWCSCAHLLSWTSSSRGLLPLPHTLSSTSRGAHALICCRGHPPLVISSLSPHTLIYQQWCSCAHLLSWTSSSRGPLPPPPTHSLSATSRGAHALICCRGHRPLVVCSLPHTLSSTSRGAHALICCRGHRPLVVCPLSPHSLIY